MLRRLSFIYLFVLILILPIKFGTMVNIGEIPVFPLGGWEWLLTGWPAFLLAPLSGLALLLVLLSSSGRIHLPGRPAVAVAAWMVLLLFSLPGLRHTTSWDFALRFLFHLLSAVCLSLAVLVAVNNHPGWRKWLLAALALGGLWIVFSGWDQVPGGGLQQTLEFAEEVARERGEAVAEGMRSRLEGGRAFGTFVYPNSYAAHLLLIGPLLLVFCYRWGVAAARWLRQEPTLARFFHHCHQLPVLFGWLAVLAGLILWGGALWFSGSRAALAALFAGLVAALLIAVPGRRIGVSLAVLTLVLGSLTFAIRQRGQDLASLDARFDYWRGAMEMVRQKPFAGVGIGEFFHYYLRWKTAEMEETRVPHNGFLFFAAQAGVLAGLGFCLIGLLPGLVLRASAEGDENFFKGSEKSRRILAFAVGTGCLAWFIHSWTDFNIIIPGTVAAMAVMPVLILTESADEGERIAAAEEEAGDRNRRRSETIGFKTGTRRLSLVLAVVGLAPIYLWPFERRYMELSVVAVDHRTLPRFEQAVVETSRWNPLSPHPWQLLGFRAESLHDPELAVAAYRQAVRRSPRRASWWFGIARNELALSNRPAAREAFHRGLEWYPESPLARELQALLVD